MQYVDTKGHRLGQKFILRSRQPMSNEGLRNFSYKARARLSRTIFKFVGSHKDCIKNYPQAPIHGVPHSCFATDQNMMTFFNQEFVLTEGVKYSLQFFSNGKTKTHIKFSSIICEFTLVNKEKNIYEISRNGRIRRMWYRKEKNQKEVI